MKEQETWIHSEVNEGTSIPMIAVVWVLSPQNSYAEAATPDVTIFGDKATRRWQRLNEVIGWDPNLIGLVTL